MNRPAHARDAILRAAEAIVSETGVTALTYDALVARSGVTRGGITYHFPTREALLQALVTHDLAAWETCLAEKRVSFSGPTADLHAYIASTADTTPEEGRVCAGLLSSTMTAPELAEPWRAYFAQHHRSMKALPDPELAMILSLAADGLFCLEMLGLLILPAAERTRLVARLHALAEEIAP
ncbi:MAG: TetR/AcrR family transcriptional regulator [Elstera sp.]